MRMSDPVSTFQSSILQHAKYSLGKEWADLSGQDLISSISDVAQHPVNQRARRHLRLTDRARRRRIDQRWQDLDDATPRSCRRSPIAREWSPALLAE